MLILSCSWRSRLLNTFLVSLFSLAATTANCQFIHLVDFNDTDGGEPSGSLMLSGNMLYGMTSMGGANDKGVIFKVDTNGVNQTVLLNFNGTNGAYPKYGSLVLSGGTLFGMTYYGGTYNYGRIFSVDTNGGSYKDLYDFNDTDGKFPNGSLILSGSTLYGMTAQGGPGFTGVIFKLDTSGTRYQVIYSLNNSIGENPNGDLLLCGGVLFGMTQYGGSNANGSVFAVDTDGSRARCLVGFNGNSYPQGGNPYGSLIIANGVLYGMARNGGALNFGVVFSVDTTDGSKYKDMLDFNVSNGQWPAGAFALSGGTLYGTTTLGGNTDVGVIFSIDTNGTSYAKIFDFSSSNCSSPAGTLVLSGGSIYGMASQGGLTGQGVLFRFNPLGVGIPIIEPNDENIVAYPNPANDVLNISATTTIQSIALSNMMGRTVLTTRCNSHTEQVNIRNIPAGVYFVTVTDENGNGKIVKIVKELYFIQ